VEQELFAPSLTFLSGVRAHVVKLYMSSRFWLRIVMTFTISALKWCSIRPICFVGYMFYSCYLYLFPYIGFRHDVHIKRCSCRLILAFWMSHVDYELLALPVHLSPPRLLVGFVLLDL
jgi:hypothetical protein